MMHRTDNDDHRSTTSEVERVERSTVDNETTNPLNDTDRSDSNVTMATLDNEPSSNESRVRLTNVNELLYAVSCTRARCLATSSNRWQDENEHVE
jgi:hypothetical protein